VDFRTGICCCKICARWMPYDNKYNEGWESSYSWAGLSHRYDTVDGAFLPQIDTGDETWTQHSRPESTRQSMKWRHTTSPWKKKLMSAQSAGKIICAVFGDDTGFVLFNFLPRETAVVLPLCCNTKKFACCPSAFRVRPTRKMFRSMAPP
jgi:hypothetical protein